MNRVHRSDTPAHPLTIAIAGGKSGVGATSVGVNLAIALAQQGLRTVIVDADLAGAAVAAKCRVKPANTIANVLAGNRGIHEALQRGPGGIQLLAGAADPQCRSLCSERAIGRLINQVRELGRHTDAVVMDLGHSPTDLMSRLWRAADRVLLITATESAAVMDAYALVKSVDLAREAKRLALTVNQATSESLALEVYHRIAKSCRSFLGLEIDSCGWLPMVADEAEGSAPWVLRQPPPTIAGLVERIAGQLLREQGDAVFEAA
jgi:flagellar biosynthesis protein FlhG